MVSASSSNYQVKIFEIMFSTIFSAYFVMQSISRWVLWLRPVILPETHFSQ